MSITTINPATGDPLDSYATHTEADVDRLLGRAAAAASAWGRTSTAARAGSLARVADVLRGRCEELAHLITSEMGKPLAEARAEVEKSARTADYYSRRAVEMLSDRPVVIDGADAWIAYEPLGVVYAVMPWNFPVWQVMRFALPALAAGNAVFLKHSPNVAGSARAIEGICAEAGIPPGLVTAVMIEEARVASVSERIITDDRVAAVTLTGSNRAGESVGAVAGRAVKKAVLELGGSDAFVVLADADVERAVEVGVRARFLNAGQSCVCAKRFIVEQPVADQFIAHFVEHAARLSVGDPREPGTDMGPLAREDLRVIVNDQVKRSLEAGAKVLLGGFALTGRGYFYEPTVLLVEGPGVPAFDEEVFGPVASIVVAADEDEAVRLANASAFGLGLSVWTADPAHGADVARRVTSGAAFINAMVASDPRLPFGGTKRSGHGRELAEVGLHEFVNIRSYWSAR